MGLKLESAFVCEPFVDLHRVHKMKFLISSVFVASLVSRIGSLVAPPPVSFLDREWSEGNNNTRRGDPLELDDTGNVRLYTLWENSHAYGVYKSYHNTKSHSLHSCEE